MLLHNGAAAVLQISLELHPHALIFRRYQSFARFLRHFSTRNALLMRAHGTVVTRVHCLLHQVGYLVNIVRVVTAIKTSISETAFPYLHIDINSKTVSLNHASSPFAVNGARMQAREWSDCVVGFSGATAVSCRYYTGIRATGYLTYIASYGYSKETGSVVFRHDGILWKTTSSDGQALGEETL